MPRYTREEIDKWRSEFYKINSDRDRYITPEELVEYGQRAGVGITTEDAASLIADLDLDKDGKVSFSEFIKALGERT